MRRQFALQRKITRWALIGNCASESAPFQPTGFTAAAGAAASLFYRRAKAMPPRP